jgi:hypothetical protein
MLKGTNTQRRGWTISYHNLYLQNATHETGQQCFATDGALLAEMLGRQSSLIAAFKDVTSILSFRRDKTIFVRLTLQRGWRHLSVI